MAFASSILSMIQSYFSDQSKQVSMKYRIEFLEILSNNNIALSKWYYPRFIECRSLNILAFANLALILFSMICGIYPLELDITWQFSQLSYLDFSLICIIQPRLSFDIFLHYWPMINKILVLNLQFLFYFCQQIKLYHFKIEVFWSQFFCIVIDCRPTSSM